MKIIITADVPDEETVDGKGDMLLGSTYDRINAACMSAGLDDIDIEEA